MVDLSTLASDVLQNVVYLVTPPLLWLLLFLLAWQSPALARATGFGRLTFWLLLPGALLGWIGNLPLVPISPAVLAVNIGGGLVPILLSAWLLSRQFGGRVDLLAAFGTLFVLETVATLLWVLIAPAASFGLPLATWGVLAIAAAVPLLLAGFTGHGTPWRPVTFGIGLASIALGATFVTTEAAPGVGIISSFPGYLLAPVLVGALAVVAAPAVANRPPYQGFAFGYAGATLGVLVGADVLHQPPLYSPPANALYSIGGAGLVDLLYLTGLFALATSFVTFVVLARLRALEAPPESPDSRVLTPAGRIRRSLMLLLSGQFATAAREAAGAAHDARLSTRALLGLPAVSFSDHPWAETGAPPWVDADQRNLDALAARLDVGARDAWRAHLTARYLVRIGRQIARRRYASLLRRSAAFTIDLLILLGPGIAIWWYLSSHLGGSFASVLESSSFNAAAYGFAAVAFLYFVVAEYGFGTTLGKLALRLKVRDRTLRPAPAIPVVVRGLPKLIPLTIVGFGGAVATLLAVRGGGRAMSAAGVTVPADLFALADLIVFVAFGVLLCGAVSAVAIYASGESQRLGDYLAGTWVIQE